MNANFHNTEAAAKYVGVSRRHFYRAAGDLGIKPAMILRGHKAIWTTPQLEFMREERKKNKK